MDNEKGLYGKYIITKADGTPVNDRCFILKPNKDPAAVKALQAYAAATEDEQLRHDLYAWVGAPDVVIKHGDKVKMTDQEKLVELLREIGMLEKEDCEYTAERLIANGVRVQEWIPVENRLPENRQRVLIYDGGATQWKSSVHAATFVKGRTHDEIMQEYRQTGRLYYTFGDEEGNNKKPYCWKGDAHMTWFGQQVTHWMPLPKPPKEE